MFRFLSVCPLVVCLLLCAVACQGTGDPVQCSTQAQVKNVPGTTKGVVGNIETFERPAGTTQLVGEDGHIMVPEPGPGTYWTFADGELTASPLIRGDSMLTPEAHGDMLMHVEFNCNDRDDTSVENTGNSGVYIQQRYEIQIQNAYGIPKEKFNKGYGGSIYRMKLPDHLVSKPAGEWQSYLIVFRAARFEDGQKTENARLTVYHNGVLIHDDFEMPRKTGAGRREGPDARPTRLQGHNNPVRFRNVWIKDLDLK